MSGRDLVRFVVAWAIALALLAALQGIWETDRVSLSELPAAVIGALALALAAGRVGDRDAWDVPDASIAAPVLGVGLTMLIAGAAVGLWLVLLGLPVVAAGVLAWVLEGRS